MNTGASSTQGLVENFKELLKILPRAERDQFVSAVSAVINERSRGAGVPLIAGPAPSLLTDRSKPHMRPFTPPVLAALRPRRRHRSIAAMNADLITRILARKEKPRRNPGGKATGPVRTQQTPPDEGGRIRIPSRM